MDYDQVCEMLECLGVKYTRDDAHFVARVIVLEDTSIITADTSNGPWDLVTSQGLLICTTNEEEILREALQTHGYVEGI